LQLVERLIPLGEKRDRSINYLVVEAIQQYLEREETNGDQLASVWYADRDSRVSVSHDRLRADSSGQLCAA